MTKQAVPVATASSPAKAQRPRDAATLIIVDRGSGEPRVLMGQRRMDQVFMPGKYVFPGGRVDKSDRLVESADELQPEVSAKLLLAMKGTPSNARARALGLAAIRETFEEAGLVIGSAGRRAATRKIPSWDPFLDSGYIPKLGALTLLARAITPPGRPRRYDTRFFCIAANEIAHRVDTLDGELSGLHWLTVPDARALDLPAITRVILEDLVEYLQKSPHDWAVPYYHHQKGSFRRDMLRIDTAAPRLDTNGTTGMLPTALSDTP
jgi:8-oxo-dGTP pyrophosphatase MutT (NUDIX family)